MDLFLVLVNSREKTAFNNKISDELWQFIKQELSKCSHGIIAIKCFRTFVSQVNDS